MSTIERCWACETSSRVFDAYNKSTGQCPNTVVASHYCQDHLRPCLAIYFTYKHYQLLADAIVVPSDVSKIDNTVVKRFQSKIYHMRAEIIYRITFTRQCIPPEHRDVGHDVYLINRLAELEKLETLLDKAASKKMTGKHSYSILGIEEGKVTISDDFADKLAAFNVPPPSLKREEVDFDGLLQNWKVGELASLKATVENYASQLWSIFTGKWDKGNLPATVMNLSNIRGDTELGRAIYKVGIVRLQMVNDTVSYDDLVSLLETVVLEHGQPMLDILPLLLKQADSNEPIYRGETVGVAVNYLQLINIFPSTSPEFDGDKAAYNSAYVRLKGLYAASLPYFQSMVGPILAPTLTLRSVMLGPLMCGSRWTIPASLKWILTSGWHEGIENVFMSIEHNPKATQQQAEAVIDKLLADSQICFFWYLAIRDNVYLFNYLSKDAITRIGVAKRSCDYMYQDEDPKYDDVRHMINNGLTNKVYKLCLINIIGKPENKGQEFMVALSKYIVKVQPMHYGKNFDSLVPEKKSGNILVFSNKDLANHLVLSTLKIFQPTAINDLLDTLIAEKVKLI